MPTLVYAGTLDEPEPAARAARAMPDARFLALEGLDHPQAFRRSDLVLPHVRAFLDRVGRAPAVSGFADTP